MSSKTILMNNIYTKEAKIPNNKRNENNKNNKNNQNNQNNKNNTNNQNTKIKKVIPNKFNSKIQYQMSRI